MVIKVKEKKINLEKLVLDVFLKSIELLGGLKKLTQYRALTWLPSLVRASYAVVLKEEFQKTEREIAAEIGLSYQTVRLILSASPEKAMEKLKKIENLSKKERESLRVHLAGGITKLAYQKLKEK